MRITLHTAVAETLLHVIAVCNSVILYKPILCCSRDACRLVRQSSPCENCLISSTYFHWITYIKIFNPKNIHWILANKIVKRFSLRLWVFVFLPNLFSGGVDKESWCLNSDGTVRHANEELYHLKSAPRESPTADLLVSTSPSHSDNEKPESEKDDNISTAVMPVEGDIIGIAYDHVDLNFFLNGKNMEIPVRNVRGTVYPALYGECQNLPT